MQQESTHPQNLGTRNADYIRIYLGLMGSGKTTQALRDVENLPRVLIFSPASTNPLMAKYPYIYDTPEYLQSFGKFLEMYPRLRIEKRAAPSPLFKILSNLRGYTIVFDDIAALKTTAEERSDFEAFVRTIRYNGNQVIITTHRARKDLPPLVQTLATSLYYVGPGSHSRREIETLYELVNYPISSEEFASRLKANLPRNGGQAAGIFGIRRT